MTAQQTPQTAEPTPRGSSVVALDGPGGSGKSTIAAGLASKLGWRHLDTGAMYRAVTFIALAHQIDPMDGPALEALVATLDLQPALSPGAGSVQVDGRRLAGELRARDVTAAVSAVSAVPAVRSRLVAEQQRIIADSLGIVVEGRDIAAVVAPQAELKIFLTARADVRAARRAAQLQDGTSRQTIEAELLRRDAADSGRVQDPLAQAPGAVPIDTSDLTADEVIDAILALRPQPTSSTPSEAVPTPAPPVPAPPVPAPPVPAPPSDATEALVTPKQAVPVAPASAIPAINAGEPAASSYSPVLVNVLQRLAMLAARLIWTMRITGRENIPRTGPVLIVGNHAGALDGPLVVAFVRRHVHILAKVELYHGRLGDFLHRVGQIPVNRGRPDRKALRAARDVLAAGNVLGIFPEGTRGEDSQEVRDVRGGAAYLALHAPCTIVPVVCVGTTEAFPRGARRPSFRAPITISFGPAFTLSVEGDPRRRSTVAAATEQIRLAMAEHLEAVRQGRP